jgi:hypothetical protein
MLTLEAADSELVYRLSEIVRCAFGTIESDLRRKQRSRSRRSELNGESNGCNSFGEVERVAYKSIGTGSDESPGLGHYAERAANSKEGDNRPGLHRALGDYAVDSGPIIAQAIVAVLG